MVCKVLREPQKCSVHLLKNVTMHRALQTPQKFDWTSKLGVGFLVSSGPQHACYVLSAVVLYMPGAYKRCPHQPALKKYKLDIKEQGGSCKIKTDK